MNAIRSCEIATWILVGALLLIGVVCMIGVGFSQ